MKEQLKPLSFINLALVILNVSVTFKINSKDKLFKTDRNGGCVLNYQQLTEQGFNKANENIKSFVFYFNGKEYHVNMTKDYPDSRKPEELVFMLNDYAGESFRPLVREYLFKDDTIYTNDTERKLTGIHNYKMYRN